MQCIVKLRDRGQVTIPANDIKALNLKKDEILTLDVRITLDVRRPE